MSEAPALFSDGKAYERLMGRWSQLAGKVFLDWLALPKGLRCLDAGCGNGVFTRNFGKMQTACSFDLAYGTTVRRNFLAFGHPASILHRRI